MDFMQKNHYNRLTRRMTEYFFSEDTCRNTFFSPLSILVLLAVAAESTAGDTRVEILKLFRDYQGTNDFSRALAGFQKSISRGDTFSSANAVCIRSDFRTAVSDAYRKFVLPEYDAELFSGDSMCEAVNRWAKKKTKGMIEQLASEDINNALFSLLNAVCFEAKWRMPFSDMDVRVKHFNNADGTKSRVKMLFGSEDYYLENDCFTGFIKSYMMSPFVFMALLPKDENESAMIRAVKYTDWLALYGSARRELVHIKLPEFRFDCELNLQGFCDSEGIRSPFVIEADFSPVADGPLFMSSLMHKSHIEVDRLGNRAAAVSFGVGVGCVPPEGYHEVFLDRPFVFAVVHRDTGLPVFIGNVNHLEDAKDQPQRLGNKLRRRENAGWKLHE